ncbi:hypothetical protein SEVIR_6G234800v4 [Setaria viridis]|uniref:Stress up-regulated Nod 19 protein n=1 Tax=Setaria viridis TaxID=4556 RepID=A0A4U6UBQ7_SETVI|nr:uncharacterized protein LOC117860088 [Setaria viridis]TKW11453.1 hypothetical protein SEVIR_6G234800v2 [Setaria viridis]
MSPLFLVLLITFTSATTQALAGGARSGHGRLLKSRTYLSPPISLRPGSVSNKWYSDVAFPRGHLALKSFNGEVVDARGAPVPLHETYLHHWLVAPYYAATTSGGGEERRRQRPNAGVCGGLLGQYFGLGAETRRTATWVPDPYGVEIGNPEAPPEGYEERWSLNVHAIDTRGAADRAGCTECRCDLYNVTVDEDGRRIGAGYAGGTHCCYDQTRCAVEGGFGGGEPRELFLRYTVMWLDWSDAAVVPVMIYILDVTDTALLEGKSEPECKLEYTVEECSPESRARNDCVDVKVTKEVLPRGGDVVYAVGHQHAGGVGTSLHGEDGRLLCWSTPTYGDGEEAGNEAGYVVGMSSCYPEPGTVKVRDGEALTVVSNYTGERRRTGVMGHFYILVADEQELPAPTKQQRPSSSLCFSFPVPWCVVPPWVSGYLQ